MIEVEDGKDRIHLETLVVSSDDDLTSLEEFYQSDRRNDRRIFQGNDELVNKVWKHEFGCLWQDDLAHGLAIRDPKASAGFHLSNRYSLDPPTDNFCDIGSSIEREGNSTCDKVVNWGLMTCD